MNNVTTKICLLNGEKVIVDVSHALWIEFEMLNGTIIRVREDRDNYLQINSSGALNIRPQAANSARIAAERL